MATVGSFDSLHLGHQAIITQLNALAERSKVSSTVVLFEPLPEEFFQVAATVRLYTLRQRLEFLHGLGVARVVCLRFNQVLAMMSPMDFIRKILVGDLGIRGLVIGEDFRFGKLRAGDLDTLKAAAEQYGFLLHPVSVVNQNTQRISSTRIRELVRVGDFVQAGQLLGRSFEVSGRVVYGDKQGTALGFPTANIACGRWPLALRGVYTGTVTSMKPMRRCLINAGYRPTFRGRQYRVEVHIPEFSACLYSQRLTVRPDSKLRDERKFDNVDALRQQINKDLKMLNRATADERL